MHGLAHFSLACRIRCTFILCVCVCSLRNTSEPRVISFSSCDVIARALRCVCGTRIRMCVCVSAALSRWSAGSSPSPGCNSNWLNLPGKLRGWLEAPSNYLTVAKPAVKNRFSCSFILPFGNKVQICCQERTTAHHFWGCVTSVIWCSLQYTEYQKWMYAPPGTKTADYIHAPLLTGAASVFESYNWPQLAGQGPFALLSVLIIALIIWIIVMKGAIKLYTQITCSVVKRHKTEKSSRHYEQCLESLKTWEMFARINSSGSQLLRTGNR